MTPAPASMQATSDLIDALREQNDAGASDAIARGAILDPAGWSGELAEAHRRGRALHPIHLAARSGSVVCLQIVLDAGGQIDFADPLTGMGPLHQACLGSIPEAVDLLILAGADVDARDREGATPAMNAALSDCALCLAALAAAGADFRLVDDVGRSVFNFTSPRSPASRFLACWLASDEKLALAAHASTSAADSPAFRI